jgi:hypothetical protein
MMHSRRFGTSVPLVLALLIAAGAMTVAVAPRAAATHEDVLWSSFRRTTGTGGFHEYYTDSVVDRDGYYYIFFVQQDTGTGASNLRLTKYTMSGMNGGPTFVSQGRVNDVVDAAYCCSFPSATVDHNGNLYVAWTRALAGGYLDVHVSRSTDGGASWDPSVRVNANTGGMFNYQPSITAAPNGNLYVAWVLFWGSSNITIAYSPNQGLSFLGERNITYTGQTSASSQGWPQLASDSLSRVYAVFYASVVSPVFRYDVYESQSDDGLAWSAPVVLGGGESWQYTPAIAVASDDTVHVIYQDTADAPSGANVIGYRQSEDRGTTWSFSMPISQGLATPWTEVPRIETSGDTVIAVWDAYYNGNNVIAYAISPDGGDVWYPEAVEQVEPVSLGPQIAVDGNGTFFVSLSEIVGGFPYDVGFIFWDGPPSAPSITGVARGPTDLTVSWTGVPESDVLAYRVWRSSDGAAYELVGTVDAATRSFNDAGLADATYWYRVSAVDNRGTGGHPSDPMSGTVGPTTEERFAAVQAELDALQAALALLQGDLDAAVEDLANLLNAVRSEQATSGQAILNTVLGVLILILLAAMFMMMRRSRVPAMMAPPGAPAVPPSPPYAPPAPPPSPPAAPSEPSPSDLDDL